MNRIRALFIILISLQLISCQKTSDGGKQLSFQNDVDFLKQYTEIIVLKDADEKAMVAVSPAWQGRVMTSTTSGSDGPSFGWINRELIASGKLQEHINVFGGEDRFWLGPEGGQFSIFFEKGVPFDLEHWYVPKEIDTEPFEVIEKDSQKAVFGRDIILKNFSDTVFRLRVNREVTFVNVDELLKRYHVTSPGEIQSVGYASINTITNTGDRRWIKKTGLLSIWILGMFKPSPHTTIVIPFKPGPEETLGPIVNDAYFGKVSSDRLVIQDNTIFFKGDGQYRSKIGVSPKRCQPVLGSYDSQSRVLTVVEFTLPEAATEYVNSLWEIQENPYGGDAVNSYNDGPPAPGEKPLGPFYELESSSPAAALKPGESLIHTHKTFHFTGPEDVLERMTKAILGVSLERIKNAFSD